MEKEEAGERGVIFKDIRRYYCDYCGICRSKKSLITAHVLAHHEKEIKKKECYEEESCEKLNACEICGSVFQKPAHLKQHMQSHSLLRPFVCPVKDCSSSFRRKDHLNRHSLQHEGKLFDCPFENCKSSFTVRGNMTRHVKLFHSDPISAGPPEYGCEEDGCRKDSDSHEVKTNCVEEPCTEPEGELFDCPVEGCKRQFTAHGNMILHVKLLHSDSASAVIESSEYKCPEDGCGKVFPHLSRLLKHADSHVKLKCVEALCTEPGCMKYFSNEKCLREHISHSHQYIACEQCGSKQLKKNIKRHMRKHESDSGERVSCSFDGCALSFSNASNLNQHVKAVHLEVKPFRCGVPGCDMRFAFKHVRDNHEKSSCHSCASGDFQEHDEVLRSRPRGGRKRKYPPFIDMLSRKRVVPPGECAMEHV